MVSGPLVRQMLAFCSFISLHLSADSVQEHTTIKYQGTAKNNRKKKNRVQSDK